MKKYPFSFIKEGHNIELAYHHQWIICQEMKDGERPYEQAAFDNLHDMLDVFDRTGLGGGVWVSGEDYGKLRNWATWACCYRDQRNCER